MSAPRIPKKESYWERKGIKPLVNKHGKMTYKNVMLYFHDDLDGIMSVVIIKKYLIDQGFNILGYGVVNYQEGWSNTYLHHDIINVCVDFAAYNPKLDVYIDHHQGDLPSQRKDYAIKTKTGSAFEGICIQYGIPLDSLTLHPIDMVDSAKYEHYKVDIAQVIHFSWKTIMNSKKPKLVFIGMINQFIKRADHHTLIEVAHNCNDVSVYDIYLKFKEFYPGNNLDRKFNTRKDFVEDGIERLQEMSKRTRGRLPKKKYMNKQDFLKDNYFNGKIDLKDKGYQVLGNLVFIPNGCWANAIRARAVIEEDMRKRKTKRGIDFILLKFGTTLQMVTFNGMNKIPKRRIPVYQKGDKKDEQILDIGLYMTRLLDDFKTVGYEDPSTYVSTIEDEITVSGGHKNIGSISNICGKVKNGVFEGTRYIDMFLNKIICDISTCYWDSYRIVWTERTDSEKKEYDMDWKVVRVPDIRTDGKALSAKEKSVIIDRNWIETGCLEMSV